MHNPSHPGLILRDDVLPELQISVNEAAEQLGVSMAASGVEDRVPGVMAGVAAGATVFG